MPKGGVSCRRPDDSSRRAWPRRGTSNEEVLIPIEPDRIEGAFDLLICDCDGVIIDSEVVCERVLLSLVEEAYPGRHIASALAGCFGLQTPAILDRLAVHLGETLQPEFVARLNRELVEALYREAGPIRGVFDALEQIALPIAIVSNSSRDWIELALERAGLAPRIGEAIFSADLVGHPKPAPDVYLFAARKIGIAPGRCLVVEDSETGVTAALAAGMSVIGFVGASHIPTHHGQRLLALGACRLVADMQHLPAAVAALNAGRPSNAIDERRPLRRRPR
jgi:HAD superfamily hydrolase (TIGR01509 family)